MNTRNMDNLFRTTGKLFILLLVFTACTDVMQETNSSNQLLDYWQWKIDLSEAERKVLAKQNIGQSSDHYLKAISNYILGNISRRNDEHKTALEHYVQAEYDLTASEMIDSRLLGHIYRNRGFIAVEYNQYEKAVTLYETALGHYNRFPEDHNKERMAILNSKGLALLKTDVNESIAVFEKLIQEARLNKDINYEVKALRLMGQVHIRMREYDKAEAVLNNAIDLFEKEGLSDLSIQVFLLQSLSRVHYYKENYPLQEAYLKKIFEVDVPSSQEYRLRVDLGENLYKQGKKQEAYELLSTLEKGFDQQPTNKDNLFIYELLIEASPANARTVYQEKWDLAQAKYEQETQSITEQLQDYHNLELAELKYIHKVDKAQSQASISRARRGQAITIIFCIFFFVGGTYFIRKKYLDMKDELRVSGDLINTLKKHNKLFRHALHRFNINDVDILDQGLNNSHK